MFFSVIIPVHNRPIPIARAIQSVLDQNHNDWECILVDDASTDQTALVCSDFAKNDPRIKFFSFDTNRGVSAARNYGLSKVSEKSGYILFLDSDDQLEANAMSKLSSILEEHDVDIIAFGFDHPGLPHDPPYYQELGRAWIRSNTLPQHLNLAPQAGGFLQPFVWNKCYKRSLIEENGIRFDEWRKTWEDNAFLVKCFDKCSSLLVVPDALYKTCEYTGLDHLSGHIDEELFFNHIASYEKNAEQFGDEFDFNNDYTPRRYFSVIQGLLLTFHKNNDEAAFAELLGKLVENETYRAWVERIAPVDANESAIVSAVKSKDIDSLIQIYQELSSKQEERQQDPEGILQTLKRIAKKLLGRK